MSPILPQASDTPTNKDLNKKIGIIVCADDFGVTAKVNEAIIGLLGQQRISAVSCLVTGKAWQEGANLLKSFRGIADIGLHLSYEEMPFNKILALSCTGRLNKELILEKFKSQLDIFRANMGFFPDYIDGHQHIHQLPVFRSALFDLLDSAGSNQFYVRNSAVGFGDILTRKTSILKNILIARPGFTLKRHLCMKNIPTNNDFLGIYDFKTSRNSGDILEELLSTVKRTNSILMCHPGCGRVDENSSACDKKRGEEFKYFESDQYTETLQRNGLFLTRFIYSPTNG